MIEERDMQAALGLFARLLLKEIDAQMLEALRVPHLRVALAELSIQLPEPQELDALSAAWFEHFLHPERGAPPIASLWIHGQYEGDVAVQLRKIAESAGYTLDLAASGGAPIDNLGCILLLWIECRKTDEALARLITDEYLEWVPRALQEVATTQGFYGQLTRALLHLLALLQDDPRP